MKKTFFFNKDNEESGGETEDNNQEHSEDSFQDADDGEEHGDDIGEIIIEDIHVENYYISRRGCRLVLNIIYIYKKCI